MDWISTGRFAGISQIIRAFSGECGRLFICVLGKVVEVELAV